MRMRESRHSIHSIFHRRKTLQILKEDSKNEPSTCHRSLPLTQSGFAPCLPGPQGNGGTLIAWMRCESAIDRARVRGPGFSPQHDKDMLHVLSAFIDFLKAKLLA